MVIPEAAKETENGLPAPFRDSGYCSFCELEFEDIEEHFESSLHRQKTKHLRISEVEKTPEEIEILAQLKVHAEKFGTEEVLKTACQMNLSRGSVLELKNFIEFGGDLIERGSRIKRIIRARTARRR